MLLFARRLGVLAIAVSLQVSYSRWLESQWAMGVILFGGNPTSDSHRRDYPAGRKRLEHISPLCGRRFLGSLEFPGYDRGLFQKGTRVRNFLKIFFFVKGHLHWWCFDTFLPSCIHLTSLPNVTLFPQGSKFYFYTRLD